MIRESGCMFCDRSEDGIWSTENFYLQLDDAPIREGHGLLCPRYHVTSIADLDSSLVDELESAVHELCDAYVSIYGKVALLEHGRTGH